MIREFFQKYFIDPIKYNTGYNPVNTLVYAIILGIATLLVYKVLKRLKIEINNAFFRALIPYMIFGAFTRALTDAGVFPRTYLTVSPGIYFLVFVIAFSALLVSHKFAKDWRGVFLWFGWGLVMVDLAAMSANISKINFDFAVLKYFIPFLILAELVVFLLSKKVSLVRENSYLFYAHFYDATTTFVGVDFMGYWEQHVLPRLLIGLTGTAAVMYVLKFIILFAAVWLLKELEKEGEEKELLDFIKMVIFILGFAPGTRNLLRMLMGV
ncbi:DUF63 domain-containing protein [Pyrococcus furiosus DSM 3638]|uniref:DUF63 domain-containing protein n=3 Tax=Pyrococcus furiosus TaxID=2261 RepID=A0A5C0XRV4_PYRFU|nr:MULTISPECIES: DUF63 family protein [Pyrococcus]AAL82137.1 hypothetical protein PF2013 [Pyrococcus furiosus DSM 3638]AFN04629.1 hypothetical protein PFC_08495 [Pyrococcus furiosus COM1]QEK79607.1 DUF63 domain-containing protein [Pyrococcus furiosus DSM 3638]